MRYVLLIAAVISFAPGSVAARTLAIASDGTLIASNADGAKLWRPPSDTPFVEFHPAGKITAVAISRNGQRAVMGTENGSLEVWDGTKTYDLSIGKAPIDDVTFYDDNDLIAAVAHDGLVSIWSTSTRADIWHSLNSPCGDFRCAIGVSSARNVVIATGIDSGKVFDANNGHLILSHIDYLLGLDNAGQTLVTLGLFLGKWSAAYINVDPTTSTAQHKWIHAPQACCFATAFSANGKLIAGSYWGRQAGIWDSTDLHPNPIRILPADSFISAITFSSDSTQIAIQTTDGIVTIWDAETGKPVRNLSLTFQAFVKPHVPPRTGK